MSARPPAESNTSTGASGNKKRSAGRDREQEAVYGNFFEQRHLDRRLTLLNSEREYAARLIDFSAREMRLHYRRLMHRVAKVRTNLTPMEILRFRHLENQGVLTEGTTSRPQSANVVRIAAATRRLQLGSSSGDAPIRSHSANVANRNEIAAREWKVRASSAYVGTAPVLTGNKDLKDNDANSSASNFSSHQALLEATRAKQPPKRSFSCAAEFGVDTNPFETDATNQRRKRLLTREKRCMSAFTTSKERFLTSCEQLHIPKDKLEDPYAHFAKMAAITTSGEGMSPTSGKPEAFSVCERRTVRESATKKSERLRREVLDTLKRNGYIP